jgi:hypothetical protein
VNEDTGDAIPNRALRAMRAGAIVGLANHTVLLRKDGTEISIDDSGSPIKGSDGGVRGAVLIFRDVTERRRSENALRDAYQEGRRRQQEAESLARVARTINTLDLDAALEGIAESASTLLGADVATVFRLDAGGESLTLVAVRGPRVLSRERGMVLRRGAGLVWLAVDRRLR